jgi:hypothetical protein
VTKLFGDLGEDADFTRQFAVVYHDIVTHGARHALEALAGDAGSTSEKS